MKIGDKVRFLNEVGGGIIKKYQNKDIVLVETEDGFEIPVMTRELVVVETDNYNLKLPQKPDSRNITNPKESEIEIDDDEKDFVELVERPGGDVLNVLLAFVPDDIKIINGTSFDAYLVNDSNYCLYYTYCSCENAAWKVRARGKIAPNMKMWLESFMQSDLNSMQRVAVQLLAYKDNKPFEIFPAMDVRLRIDTVKFYKVHCFSESEFFEKPSMRYDIVKDNLSVRQLRVSPKELEKEMMVKKNIDTIQPARVNAKTEKKDEIEVIDLHIDELLDTTAGMSNAAILNLQLQKFRETVEKFSKNKGKRIVFIHGKGEGILRKAIIEELKRKYKSFCVWHDASFQEYGFGATEVVIK